jgi:hypothetical protein
VRRPGSPPEPEPLPYPCDDSPQWRPPCNLEGHPSSNRCIPSSRHFAVCLAPLFASRHFCLLPSAYVYLAHTLPVALCTLPFAMLKRLRRASKPLVSFETLATPSHRSISTCPSEHRQVSFSTQCGHKCRETTTRRMVCGTRRHLHRQRDVARNSHAIYPLAPRKPTRCRGSQRNGPAIAYSPYCKANNRARRFDSFIRDSDWEAQPCRC